MSKKTWIVLGVIVLIGIIIFFWWMSTYNGLVAKEEKVETAWAQVENVYDRKYELIPNLVATVKDYTEYEGNVLKEVTEARSNATQIKLSADDLTPENMKKFQEAQAQLTGSLSRLLATFERYPDLKANANYQKLMQQLEGSENRITVERRKFNEAVREYNTSRRGFLKSIVAERYGFEKKELFEASEEAVANDTDVKELFGK